MDIPLENNIKSLISHVEKSYGSPVRTPKQFDSLRDSILKYTGVLMSSTTLKRLWGYLDEKVEPRESTLNVLATYIGLYRWQDFLDGVEPGSVSRFTPSAMLDVRRDLRKGEIVRLRWFPNRVCDLEYLGSGEFKVIAAKNTHLQVDDRFICQTVISGERLYLNNLMRKGQRLGGYVCGIKKGVTFVRLHPDSE